MKIRMRVLGTVVCAAALMATGCGNLSIRSWVKVITDQSNGSLQTALLGPTPIAINRLQGGFLGAIVLDTRTLPAPLDGTLAVEDVRILGDASPSLAGVLCIWGDPAHPSNGTVHLDILGSQGSATVTLNLKASSFASDALSFPPAVVSQEATFPLNGVGLTQLLSASSTGSGDGLFATSADFVGETVFVGSPATFSLHLEVTNNGTPPLFDADLIPNCTKHFNEQGRDFFYGVNSKSSYLLADGEHPQPPLVIKLAELGAAPGNKLKIDRVGTYNDKTELRDGSETKAGAVFSSTNVIKRDNQRNRIPGAIDAGTDVTTGSYLKCIIFPFCTSVSTDIAEDFSVSTSATVTIPAGAQYLIVAPTPDSLKWSDDSGFGFGVAITVNP
jgi:hypothetical protein